jgi:hypothetical protein
MKIKIIEADSFNASFANADGTYNTDHMLHFQTMGKPTSGDAASLPSLNASTVSRLKFKFESALGKKQPALFATIRDQLVKNHTSLWSTHHMGGFEYEGGRVYSYIASRLAESKMASACVEVDVNLDILNPRQYFEAEKSTAPTLRQQKEKDGITLPQTAKAKVWIVAPEAKLATAIDMITKLANAEEYPVTHRGFGFNHAVAEQISQTQSADPMKHRTAWFEIHTGVFLTIDEDQFNRFAKIANAKPAAAAASAKPSNGPAR